VVFKRKTRDTPGGRKHSLHLVPELCDVPREVLKSVCAAVFAPHRDQIRQPAFSGFTDEELRASEFAGADLQTMGGNTPFSMAFSSKTDDPAELRPAVVHRAFYRNGELHVFPMECQPLVNPVPFAPPPEGGQHSLEGLTDDQAVHLLWQSSCSIPRRYMAPVKPDFRKDAEIRQSRTDASLRGISGGGPPARGGPRVGGAGGVEKGGIRLPDWFKRHFTQQGCTERQSSAQSYLSFLPSLDCPGADPAGWKTTHLDKSLCPHRLSLEPPVLYTHTNNGVIAAVNSGKEGRVYVRCTFCCDKTPTNEHVTRMQTQAGFKSAWIELTEEGLVAITSEEGQTRQHFFVSCRSVCSKTHVFPGRRQTQKKISDELARKRQCKGAGGSGGKKHKAQARGGKQRQDVEGDGE